jgi:hypothetical protein
MFTFNGQTKNLESIDHSNNNINKTESDSDTKLIDHSNNNINKTESDSDTKPIDTIDQNDQTLSSSSSSSSDQEKQEDVNMTENGLNKMNVKRSHSPETINEQTNPFKKAKEEKTTQMEQHINTFKEQSPPVEEEILDTLPPPASSNIQSLNSNSRLSTPPLAVVKNSIRVNIGCCTKK